MTAERKLQRYEDKDYSEVVEFPVELVDRDGVVRLYSYEDSLRVYLRRIASAPWRYADDSVIAAEVDHCNKRIDQLRRSYLLRCKALGEQVDAAQRTTDQCVVGEGLTLLEDHLVGDDGEGADDLGDLDITAIAEGDVPSVYQVVQRSSGRYYLLYVYPSDAPGADEIFEDQRRMFEGALVLGGDRSERLCLHRKGEMASFLLTERVAVVDQEAPDLSGDDVVLDLHDERSWPNSRSAEDTRPAQHAFTAGLAALRRREPEEAILQFKETIEANPYHREAYLALSTLLDMTGEEDEGGLYVAMAVAYYPDDGLIRFAQGLNHLRRGQRGEALEAFQIAADLDPGLYQPRYFAGLLLAIDDRLVDAERALVEARELTRREQDRVDAALRWVRGRRRFRRWVLALSGTFALAALIALPWNAWVTLGSACAAVLVALAQVVQARLARHWLARSASHALIHGGGEEP